MQRFYIPSVEIALEYFEENCRPVVHAAGGPAWLFAAMERRVERSAQDVRDWWALEGRAAMRAHLERVRARSRARDART
jgi:hypothetical protein